MSVYIETHQIYCWKGGDFLPLFSDTLVTEISSIIRFSSNWPLFRELPASDSDSAMETYSKRMFENEDIPLNQGAIRPLVYSSLSFTTTYNNVNLK